MDVFDINSSFGSSLFWGVVELYFPPLNLTSVPHHLSFREMCCDEDYEDDDE